MAKPLKPRHLVAVSWCMPPAQFPRSIQVSRLLKGLQPLNWQASVVTPRLDCAGAVPIDPALEKLYSKHYVRVPVDLTVDREHVSPTLVQRWRGITTDAELSDEQLWIRRAAAAVKDTVRRTRARAIVTFAQPWHDHLVGLELLRWRGRPPWIAHFSDPWSDSLYYADLPEAKRKDDRRQERRVIEGADLVVFTNQYAADLVMAKYPETCRKKVRVLPHVADPDLLAAVESLRTPQPPNGSRPLRLSHVGNLFIGRRTAYALFEAIAALGERWPLREHIELVFVGEGSGLEEARQHAEALGLDSIVTFRMWQSHFESVAAMRDTDVLVLIDAAASTNVFFPSKLVDYLIADKPILALTPAIGPSADITRELGYTPLDPGDVAGITASIEALLQKHIDGSLTSSSATRAVIDRYHFRHVARSFAGLLDDLVSTSGTRLFVTDRTYRIARRCWHLLPAPFRYWLYQRVAAGQQWARAVVVEANRFSRQFVRAAPRWIWRRTPIPPTWRPHVLKILRAAVRIAMRVAHRILHVWRRVIQAITLYNNRMNASVFWPGVTGVDLWAVSAALSLLRFHSSALKLAWCQAHHIRKWRMPRALGGGRVKVLHVTSSFDLGGTQTQIRNLCVARASAAFDHDAVEIFPEMNYLYRRDVTIDVDRYGGRGLLRRTAGRLVSYSGSRSPQLVQIYKLVRDFRAIRPDVVVGWGHEMCASTFVAAAIARVPRIVFCIRTFNPTYGWMPEHNGELLLHAHRRMWPHVATIITNSTLLREDHARWLGFAPDRIRVCANGIDVVPLTHAEIAAKRAQVRERLGIRDHVWVISNVGRFSPEKGQGSLFAANERLRSRYPAGALVWVLCGDGRTMKDFQDQTASLAINNVIFVGRTNDVHDYLCASDAFVMPSDFEGMPNAMMEAMGCGLPCVSTNRSGALDVARDGIEALYYEPRNIDQLVRHLERLIDNKEEARAMGQRAMLRMREFSVQRFVHTFEQTLASGVMTQQATSGIGAVQDFVS
jgi:glycosyltransferase involved in cell wall biosynthesis